MEENRSNNKKFIWFIGLDISKHTIDFAVYKGASFVLHKEIENQRDAIISFCNELRLIPTFKTTKALFCMEESGVYCKIALNTLFQLKAFVTVENDLRVKRSLGLVRGKDDKNDAIQIAVYARKNSSELRAWE